MRGDVVGIVDSFAGLRVTVVGDAILDAYVSGPVERLCREAPVPVVHAERESHAPGGAGNEAVNLVALGAKVRLLACVGADEEGEALRRELSERGVGIAGVLTETRRHTLVKRRVLADGQMVVRVDSGDTRRVSMHVERELTAALEAAFEASDAVVVSDYGYGAVTPGMIRALARAQAAHPLVLAVDSRRLPAYRDAGVTLAKPNAEEVAALLGELPPGRRPEAIAERGDELLSRTGAGVVAVTLDAQGAVVLERGSDAYRTYASPRPHVRVAGAGDTFLAAFTLALAAGAPVPHAAELASAAAAVVVGRDGTAPCTADDLREAAQRGDKVASSAGRLAQTLARRQLDGARVVFTNGCFDILHAGHIAFLNQAKALGDVLVVGVNSDESVRRVKGPGRPVNALDDRLRVLAALSAVDHVVVFGDVTADRLLRELRPDVFVKGGDYAVADIPERPVAEELGARIEILPYVADRSTSGLIERIGAAYAENRR